MDYPLTVRNATAKDTIMISGHPVEVRRLFIDWKMPMTMRKYWPVIINKKGEIIYIPRYQKDFQKEDSPCFYVKLK